MAAFDPKQTFRLMASTYEFLNPLTKRVHDVDTPVSCEGDIMSDAELTVVASKTAKSGKEAPV